MRYQVFWTEAAEAELASIWVAADDRHAVSQAADGLDRELRMAPNQVGESRSGNRRIAHWLPLGISFEVCEEDRQVSVVAVWECRKTGR